MLPNHFTDADNRCIYCAICSLARKGITQIDPFIVKQELEGSEATRHLANGISEDQLHMIEDSGDALVRDTFEGYRLLVDAVKDSAFRRDIYTQLRECQRLCLQESAKSIQPRIYKLLDEVMEEFSAANDIPPYSEVVDKYWEEIEMRQRGDYAGIPFKFPALNDYVTIEPGELFIFGAEQKQGKSMMLLNCAVDLLKKGQAVLYLDSELNTRLFTARLMSHLSGVAYKQLTSGRYTEEEKNRIMQAKEWIKEQKFTHIYIPTFDTQSIYTAVKKVKHTQGLDVLIVDYFKSKGEGDAFDSYQELGRFVDSFCPHKTH